MPSSITKKELEDLASNPELLRSEIDRYTKVRDDAESKLRAVVDETTARELRELAEQELHKARLEVETANDRAAEILAAADIEASEVRSKSETDARSIVATARTEADAVMAAARQIHEREAGLRDALEQRTSEAERMKESASRTVAINTDAAKRHNEEADALNSARQRLADLVKQMTEIVGDGKST